MTHEQQLNDSERQAHAYFEGPERRATPRLSRLQFTHFFCTFMVCITFYLLIDDILLRYSVTYDISEVFTLILLLAMVFFFTAQIWRDRLPLSVFGFTTVNWRFALTDSLKWTALVILFITLAKALLLLLLGKWSWLSLIDHHKIFSVANYTNEWGLMLIYFAGIPLQEIIGRGMVQTYFTSVFVGRYYAWAGNVVATCYFAIFHSHVSFELPLFVISLSLFWGWLFMRQRNLLGCTLSHILISFWGYYILTIQHVHFFMY